MYIYTYIYMYIYLVCGSKLKHDQGCGKLNTRSCGWEVSLCTVLVGSMCPPKEEVWRHILRRNAEIFLPPWPLLVSFFVFLIHPSPKRALFFCSVTFYWQTQIFKKRFLIQHSTLLTFPPTHPCTWEFTFSAHTPIKNWIMTNMKLICSDANKMRIFSLSTFIKYKYLLAF